MNNDDEIRDILLDILTIGLLRIRAFGNASSAETCSIEADHLHNIPGLVKSLHREEILHYYKISRTSFLSSTSSNVDAFKPHWERLATLIGETNDR